MTRDRINYSHGDTGSKPADGNEFASGERPDAQIFDWFWNRVTNVINSVWDEFDRLDSDDDGVVDEADTANLYKGNDIDSNGDGIVDEADTANLYKGNDIDSDGDGIVDNADKVDGFEGAELSGAFSYVQNTEPSSPNIAETWFDTSTGVEEGFVWNGSSWEKISVEDHAELSNIQSDQHHAKPTNTQTHSGGEITTSYSEGTGTSLDVYGKVTRIYTNYEGGGGSTSVTLYTPSGTQTVSDSSAGSGDNVTYTPNELVTKLDPESNTEILEVDTVVVGPHSHNI